MTSPADQPELAPEGVRDFTIRREPIPFTIDDDRFEAPNTLAPTTLAKLAGALEGLSDIGQAVGVEQFKAVLHKVADLMRALLPGKHGQLFVKRLLSEGNPAEYDDVTGEETKPADPTPIDLMQQAIPVLYFLLESYGLRPTVPSSPLSAGSTDAAQDSTTAGTFSTDGVFHPESITAA